MSFLPKDPLFVGVEVTSTHVRLALLKKKKTRLLPLLLEEVPLEDKKRILKLIPTDALVVTALPSKEILYKSLHIPLKGEKEIAAAFDFQVEPLLPYPLDKCVVDYVKVGERPQGTSLTVFSAKKEALQRHLETCKNTLSLVPEVVSTHALALTALAEEAASPEPVLFMHIGEEGGTCTLLENGKLMAARFFEKEAQEVEKTILSLTHSLKGKSVASLLLISEAGKGSELLSEASLQKVVIPTFKKFHLSQEELNKYAIPLGLAAAAAKKNPATLRKKEFAPSFPWKRLKSTLYTYLTLALLLGGAVFTLSHLYSQKKEAALMESFEALTGQKLPSFAQFDEALSSFETSLNTKEEGFPLAPLVPKVRDALAALATYSEGGITTEDFHYQIVSRPNWENPAEHYLVKVTLLLKCDKTDVAERYHNFLKSNPLVDATQTITWEALQGNHYRAIFCLKDKTVYH